MSAALTVSPTEVQVGDAVVITGSGFLADTVVTLTIPETGESFETVSDEAGGISSDDLADRAFAVLTSSGVQVTANDTVTIGAVTYTFKGSVTTTANEVLLEVDAATTLANLKAAINLTGPAGKYGSATVIHPTVTAGALTATTLRLFAKTAGTGGNSLVSTKSAATLSLVAGTFAGGAASTGVSSLIYTPTTNTPFTIQATDGTNTASISVKVFTQ